MENRYSNRFPCRFGDAAEQRFQSEVTANRLQAQRQIPPGVAQTSPEAGLLGFTRQDGRIHKEQDCQAQQNTEHIHADDGNGWQG